MKIFMYNKFKKNILPLLALNKYVGYTKSNAGRKLSESKKWWSEPVTAPKSA